MTGISVHAFTAGTLPGQDEIEHILRSVAAERPYPWHSLQINIVDFLKTMARTRTGYPTVAMA